jgi:hypothetical protein
VAIKTQARIETTRRRKTQTRISFRRLSVLHLLRATTTDLFGLILSLYHLHQPTYSPYQYIHTVAITMSLAKERRLGLPRADLASLRGTRTAVDTEDENDDSSVDDHNEEDRLLSERHGEAAEDNSASTSRKKKLTDQEIADEYNQDKKKPRRSNAGQTLQPEHVVGSKGLAVIRTRFPTKFDKDATKKKRGKNQRDMAAFSSQLVTAYQQWSDDLLPGVPLEEVLWKLYTLNSKAQVKHQVQTMERQIRNDHVERLFGLEKAEHMISQLEAGMQLEVDYNNNNQDATSTPIVEMAITTEEAAEEAPVLETTLASTSTTGEEESPTTTAAATAEEEESPTEPATTTVSPDPKRNTDGPPTTTQSQANRRRVLQDDSSDEEELTFEDDDDDDDNNEPTSVTTTTTPSSQRRAILEDSSDEELEVEKEDTVAAPMEDNDDKEVDNSELSQHPEKARRGLYYFHERRQRRQQGG